MDISRAAFPFEVVNIIERIVSSHFVAIDLEFSGIATRQNRSHAASKGRGAANGRLTLQELYSEAREAAEKYQVLQVGLTVVEERDDGTYMLRPYSFYLNPIPGIPKLNLHREWSFSSGAVDFLLRNGFQFDLPYTEGVPYLSRKEEQTLRATWAEEAKSRATIPDMPVKPEDQAFVDLVKKTVTNWLNEPEESHDPWLNIPPPATPTGPVAGWRVSLNGWERRMIHQIVRNEFSGLIVNGKGTWMQILERNEERDNSAKIRLDGYRERDLSYGTEFRWLVEALTGGNVSNIPLDYHSAALPLADKCKVTEKELKGSAETLQAKVRKHNPVLVGHNLFLDLIYLYSCFIGDLPEQVLDFQTEIEALFPTIVDTKWIASYKSNSSMSTSLEDMEMSLRDQEYPKIQLTEGFAKYESEGRYHEAGFDSYLTALLAIRLSAKMKGAGSGIGVDTSLSAFGVLGPNQALNDESEEEFVTPPESMHGETESEASTTMSTVTRVFSKPMGTVKDAFAKVISRNDESESVMSNNETQRNGLADLMLDNSSSADTEHVRKSFAHTTISSAARSTLSSMKKTKKLTKRKKDQNQFDLLIFSDSGSEASEEVDLLEMATRGQAMPRWEDTGFWEVFGNRLRVNGCVEGVCKLGK